MNLVAAIPVIFSLLCAAILPPSPAEARSIEDFFGSYVGRSISQQGEGLSERDLSVIIQPHEKGFTVQWTTVTQEAGDKIKRKSYSINFMPTPRQNIYAAAMRPNLFGGWQPLDPMKGDPYVWARLQGDTLTVYALLVTPDGGYEMQIYDRTLTDEGMRLTFSRFREGQPLKQITGLLTRQDG